MEHWADLRERACLTSSRCVRENRMRSGFCSVLLLTWGQEAHTQAALEGGPSQEPQGGRLGSSSLLGAGMVGWQQRARARETLGFWLTLYDPLKFLPRVNLTNSKLHPSIGKLVGTGSCKVRRESLVKRLKSQYEFGLGRGALGSPWDILQYAQEIYATLSYQARKLVFKNFLSPRNLIWKNPLFYKEKKNMNDQYFPQVHICAFYYFAFSTVFNNAYIFYF